MRKHHLMTSLGTLNEQISHDLSCNWAFEQTRHNLHRTGPKPVHGILHVWLNHRDTETYTHKVDRP